MDQDAEVQSTVGTDTLIENARKRERQIDLTGEIVNRIGALNLQQLESLDVVLKVIEKNGEQV